MSFDVFDGEAMSMRLNAAILLYARGDFGGDAAYRKINYATVHPVDNQEGQATPVIRAGRPVDVLDLKAICTSLLASTRFRSGVLPDNILNVGLEHVVWWQRPGRRTYFFNCSAAPSERISIGQRAGSALTPGIVFAVRDKTLWAYALKGDERPDAQTPLYHLPVMNVWKDGRVCCGSTPLPDSTVAESVKAWEDAFWRSAFTHPNHDKPVNYQGGIHQFSIDLLDGKFRKFPQRVLRPIKGLALGNLIEALETPSEES